MLEGGAPAGGPRQSDPRKRGVLVGCLAVSNSDHCEWSLLAAAGGSHPGIDQVSGHTHYDGPLVPGLLRDESRHFVLRWQVKSISYLWPLPIAEVCHLPAAVGALAGSRLPRRVVWHSLVVARPEILPMPPIAARAALPWNHPVTDAVASLVAARETCGDTFVVDSGPDRYLFTFSARGVSAFYGLPEDHASKGVADWRMLRRKLPDELFDGRRTLPHDLFGRADAATYLAHVDRALDATVVELGDSGSVDLFDLSRRLGHRVGLASWGGPGSAEGPTLSTLTAAFDTLDGAESFVHPDAMAAVAANDKQSEREALERIVAQFTEAARTVESHPDISAIHPLFARIVQAWQSEEGDARYRESRRMWP